MNVKYIYIYKVYIYVFFFLGEQTNKLNCVLMFAGYYYYFVCVYVCVNYFFLGLVPGGDGAFKVVFELFEGAHPVTDVNKHGGGPAVDPVPCRVHKAPLAGEHRRELLEQLLDALVARPLDVEQPAYVSEHLCAVSKLLVQHRCDFTRAALRK